MQRLLKSDRVLSIPELLAESHHFVEAHHVTLILKGAPTFIFSPNQIPHISAQGDPGLATAGSGDILTGITAALLAQLKDPFKAALLATDLHGRAGELAAKKLTSYCLVAQDILDFLPDVFKFYLDKILI
jgi:ADP-dependent NAD(P)H-hydrate dehydratase / NAD(P)H-hydrate epimerase